jgi:hypothetical protein
MKDRIVFIDLDDWRVIYFKGKKFAEGHSIPTEKLIRLGMLMREASINISDMIRLSIETDEVSEESILWDWDSDIENLHDEVKAIISKNIN